MIVQKYLNAKQWNVKEVGSDIKSIMSLYILILFLFIINYVIERSFSILYAGRWDVSVQQQVPSWRIWS